MNWNTSWKESGIKDHMQAEIRPEDYLLKMPVVVHLKFLDACLL